MQILFLSQVLPYPVDAGPKMRSYYVMRYLARQHQVTLLTFVRDTDRPEDIAHLAGFCHKVETVPLHRSRLRDMKYLLQSRLTRQPFLIIRDQLPAMIDKIRQLVQAKSFDIIHSDQLWMAQYALIAKQASTQSKLVLDQHNAVYLIPERLALDESNPLKRWFLQSEAHFLAAYETDVCHRFDQVVWVTREDQEAVAAVSNGYGDNKLPATVIPICADPTQVQPLITPSSKPRITFLGGLHWPPNAQGILWFAREVFPQVQAQIPGVTLTIIGKNPPVGLEGSGIEVTGYVTDLEPYLAETGAFIVPLHAGGGMRVKILDAWSWGLPVVSTTIGAEGIETRTEQNILIADTAHTFAEAVVRILNDPTLARTLRENGRQTVLEKYNWQTVYSKWDEVYRDLRPESRGVQ